MGNPAFPLPRKLFTDPSTNGAALRNRALHWHVHPTCIDLWRRNKERGRQDTFIGLIDTDTWTIYAAPCFGVTGEEGLLKLPRILQIRKAEAAAHVERMNYDKDRRKATPLTDTMLSGATFETSELRKTVKERLDVHDVPDDLVLVSGSTSAEADAARELSWSEVKGVYGPHGACLVLFEQAKLGFDGKSHQAMKRWVDNHVSPRPAPDWWSRALGFAIQRDKVGYYVRFSSTLNLNQGMNQGSTFNARVNPADQDGRETRDMPKQWAQRLVLALANDLHVGYFPEETPNAADHKDRTQPGKFFGRMVSRGEHETTKYKRIYEANFVDAVPQLFSRLT